MPTVLDAPERIEYVETHELPIERPQRRRTHGGFWRALAHGITRRLTPASGERQASSYRAPRPFETPMDRFAREYPSLSLYALAII